MVDMMLLMIFPQYRRKLDFIPHTYAYARSCYGFSKNSGVRETGGVQGRGNAEDAGFGLSDGE
jgi:hypothetical protein